MILEQVKSYISHLVPAGTQLQEDSTLITNGLIDSMSVVDLIVYLEKEFQVKFSDTEMTPENFDTLSAISSLIERKRRAS